MYFDCSLDSFKITGFPGYVLPFGTKLPDGQSADARDMMTNIAMPFMKGRPLRVPDNSTTSPVETNCTFEFISLNTTLVISSPRHNGIQVAVINSGDGPNTIIYGLEKSKQLESGKSFHIESIKGEWVEVKTGSGSGGDSGDGGDGGDGLITVATYSELPFPGVNGSYYLVLQDNLIYQYSSARSRYETHFLTFASLPASGISSRFYITDDTGKLYTWHTNKYAEHYAAAAVFPITGTPDRKYYAEDSNLIYEWGNEYGQYVLRCPYLSSFPAIGIPNIIYIADNTGLTYFWDTQTLQYSRREGGGGTQGSGNNVIISEQNLLTVLGVNTVAEAIEELHTRLNNQGSGTEFLSGLNIGMYLDLPELNDGTATISKNDTYQNLRIRIAGFNTYQNEDNPLNHIQFEFKNIPITKAMRSANTNDGGYPKTAPDTTFKTYLESGFFQGLRVALGLTEIDRQGWIMESKRKVTTGQYGAWTKSLFASKIFPLTEKEIFGMNTYGDSATENDLPQVPIYLEGVSKVKKYNGSATYWWEGSPYAAGTSNFCAVHSGGAASTGSASYVWGLSPCFCLC